jgi:hypothetical protein
MTRKQARAAYTRIVDKGNRLTDLANNDYTDRVAWSQFVADLRAANAALRKEVRELAAVRWPARIQPYVLAMVATDFPANIACHEAMIKSGSYTGVDTANATNADCRAASASTTPDTIRDRLGLPPSG